MGEYAAKEGDLDATGMRFAIVVARFNRDITDRLLDGAERILRKHEAAEVTVLWVPGAFAAQIAAALGDATRVVNVGGGTGSYEPHDRFVAAAEVSLTMLRQRSEGAAPAVQSRAEALPFRDDAFDAALASLTLHHWEHLERGLSEMQRVARAQVIFFFEPTLSRDFWLFAEYFPEIADLESERAAPGLDRLAATLAVRH